MFTLIYADTEGWPVVEQFETREEVDEFMEETIPPTPGNWYNPAPQLICGENHEIVEFEGYRYI